jgi:hypothetical protein
VPAGANTGLSVTVDLVESVEAVESEPLFRHPLLLLLLRWADEDPEEDLIEEDREDDEKAERTGGLWLGSGGGEGLVDGTLARNLSGWRGQRRMVTMQRGKEGDQLLM